MSNFWMALVAAQTTAADTKPASRRRQILSVVGGIALALLIGAGLFIAAALTLWHLWQEDAHDAWQGMHMIGSCLETRRICAG